MKRRKFGRLLASTSLWPVTTHAQTMSMPKVGFVATALKQTGTVALDAIVDGLRTSGYAPPKIEMIVLGTEGDPSKVRSMVAEVLGKNVSVFIAGGPAILRAAREITRTVPIVAYDFETDPVAEEYAQSIARPGGNVTGVFLDLPSFPGKWVELLRDCLPRLSRVALIWDPTTGRVQVDSLRRIAAGLNIQTELLEVTAPADFDGAFAAAKKRGAEAVILLSSPLVFVSAQTLAELAQRQRLPAITLFSQFARAGGLFSYGPNLVAVAKQAGFMAGKVLAGSAPASIPLERPSTYELIVNQRAAEALGLTLPPSILARADEVIE